MKLRRKRLLYISISQLNRVINHKLVYKPGDLVSIDQFVVNNPVQLTTGYGQESFSSQFHGVSLYNHADTGITWVENQVSLGASETVLGKETLGK